MCGLSPQFKSNAPSMLHLITQLWCLWHLLQ